MTEKEAAKLYRTDRNAWRAWKATQAAEAARVLAQMMRDNPVTNLCRIGGNFGMITMPKCTQTMAFC
jgi:hypothetical protein